MKHPIVNLELEKLKHQQKPNYQNILMQVLADHQQKNERPHVLIHSCCAVCNTVALDLLVQYMDITVYFYNPNIHPKVEYVRRAIAQKKFIEEYNRVNKTNIKYIEGEYIPSDFFAVTKGMEDHKEGRGERCLTCYHLRMKHGANKAKELKADYFMSSLTFSPMKDAMKINKIGFDLAEEYNVMFLPSDLKKNNGSMISRNLVKEYDVFRQEYCGCIFASKDQGINIREIVKSARKYINNETNR